MNSKIRTLVVVCILAVITGKTPVIAQEEGEDSASPISIAGDVTYASRYYWRGSDLSNGTTSFLQPSIDVSYAAESGGAFFSVGTNIWYSQGVEDGTTIADNSEIDYGIYASASVGLVDISAGVTDYVVPNDIPFSEGDVIEANAGVSINTLPFDNSVTFYLNLDGDDDDSMYIAPSVGYTYKNLNFGLTFGIALGESAYYGTDSTKLIDITPSVSYAVPFGENEVSISLNIGYNPHTNLKTPYVTIGTGFSITD